MVFLYLCAIMVKRAYHKLRLSQIENFENIIRSKCLFL